MLFDAQSSPRMSRLFDILAERPRTPSKEPLDQVSEKLQKVATSLEDFISSQKKEAGQSVPQARRSMAESWGGGFSISRLHRSSQYPLTPMDAMGFGLPRNHPRIGTGNPLTGPVVAALRTAPAVAAESGKPSTPVGASSVVPLVRTEAPRSPEGQKPLPLPATLTQVKQVQPPANSKEPKSSNKEDSSVKAENRLTSSLGDLSDETKSLTDSIQKLSKLMSKSAEDRLAAEIRERQERADKNRSMSVKALAPAEFKEQKHDDALPGMLKSLFGLDDLPDIDLDMGGDRDGGRRRKGNRKAPRVGKRSRLSRIANSAKNLFSGRTAKIVAGTAVAGAAAAAYSSSSKATPATPSTDSPKPSSAQADKAVKDVVSEVAPDASKAVNGSTTKVGQITTSKGEIKAVSSSARSLGKGLTKALGPLAVVLSAVQAYSAMEDLYGMYQAGDITEEEFEEEFAALLGQVLGGAGGAAIGAQLGALGGGALGTVVPGVGNVVGGLVGGVAGAVGGGFAGDALGSKMGRQIYRSFLAKPQTANPAAQVGPGRRIGPAPDLRTLPSSEFQTNARDSNFTDQSVWSRMTSSTPPAPPGKISETLGDLSARYESASAGSSAIGQSKTDGFAYGKYQIATRPGTMNNFMKYLKEKDPERYSKLQEAGGVEAASQGSESFKGAWKDLAKDKDFGKLEHEFIQQTHYDPLVGKIFKETGVNVNERSKALQDVVWSTSVQHGGGTNVVSKALKSLGKEGSEVSDDELIQAIYGERGTRFQSSDEGTRAGVKKRFVDEERRALAMLDVEQAKSLPQEGTIASVESDTGVGQEVVETQANIQTAETQRRQEELAAMRPPAPPAQTPTTASSSAGSGESTGGFTTSDMSLSLAVLNSGMFG